MVGRVLRDGYAKELPIGVSFKVQDRLETHAPDLPQAQAATLIVELGRSWAARLPEGGEALFSALVAMPGDELVSLVALCVARTVDGVSEKDGDRCTARLAQSVGLDMGAWWTPTAESYFTHVSKATILEGAQQFAPTELTRLGKLKKADLVSEAERLAAGTGWLPPMLRPQEVADAEDVTLSERDVDADEHQADGENKINVVEEAVAA